MNEPEAMDVETVMDAVKEPSLAVGPHQPENAAKTQITPAQAKVDAIASLTMSAYQKASQLVLTPEEVEKLQAEFPDEAFKPGAAGKDNLIYIEHAFLRDRLNHVFGPGQWAIVPRNRWAENYKTSQGKDAVRVYVEAMLCIRGCFAAEAIGDMDYFPHNASTNYGDAVEGAKSSALRRCVKELGVGLQAWKKDWCEGWWQRKRGKKPAPTPFKKPEAAPKAATKSDVLPKAATVATRDWFLKEMTLAGVVPLDLLAWGRERSALLPNEELTDWPLDKVPTSKQALVDTLKQVVVWQKGQAGMGASEEDPAYFDVILTIPRKGQKRDDYLRNPDTIGSLYHAMKAGNRDAQSRLWGFAHNFEVATSWEGSDGKEHLRKDSEIAADRKLREALDQFMADHGNEGGAE